MSEKLQKYSIQEIENRIFTIRGTHVMIDRDIAKMYDVETKVLNQAVKRNLERFPEKFRFQLLQDERNELVTNCDRLKKLKHSSVLPYAFTEQGVAMLSAVLNSKTAIQVSLQIMNAFVEMRKFITSNANVFQRLDIIEKNHLQFKSETNQNFDEIFHAIDGKRLNRPHTQRKKIHNTD